MAGYALVSGLWAVPNIDSTDDQQVRAHVSIAVEGVDALSPADVDLAVAAGDVALEQVGRPEGRLAYVTLRQTAAIAFFVFANPEGLTPTSATVTLLGESVSFDVSPSEPGGDGPPVA